MFIATQVDWVSNAVEADCDNRAGLGGFRVDGPARDADAGCLKTTHGVSHGLCRQSRRRRLR